MYYCILVVSLVLVISAAEKPTVSQELLDEVFGPAPVTKPPAKSVTPLENIEVEPTTGPSTFTDKNGESCQCVPYYLCDGNNVGVNINNVSVTGYGELDIRFGDTEVRTCQESVEVCCTRPKDPAVVPKPKPNPDKLKGCGYSNPKGLGVTIVGGNGNEAQFGEFPWVVALINSRNNSYTGVGVLIHPQVVMTGAKVAYQFTPDSLTIRAGEWDTQTVKEIFEYQDRNVEEIYYHKDFNSRNLKNDIALLRLAKPVDLAEHVNMLCLPGQAESFDTSKDCVSNGWGQETFGATGRYAVILKKVVQDMVAHQRCQELLRRTRLGKHFKLHSSFVCAGGEEGKDTCKGDGGAPLACPIGNDRYKLAGLVAWGIGCGEKDVPAVYASVAEFRNWVDAKMNEWDYGTASYTV